MASTSTSRETKGTLSIMTSEKELIKSTRVRSLNPIVSQSSMPAIKAVGKFNERVKAPIMCYKLGRSSLTKSGKAGGKAQCYPPSAQLQEHAKHINILRFLSTFNLCQILAAIYQILVVLANLLRRHSSNSLKVLCQVTLARETYL